MTDAEAATVLIHHAVTVRGVRMAVTEAGSGDALLCLHGFTGNWETWWPLLAPLAQERRLIMPDLLGHGESDAPRDPARYAAPEAVLDLCAILDALGVGAAEVLGYSMGGRLALSLACFHPQRVRALILESASPGLRTEAERAERRAADEALADRIEADGVAAFVAYWEQLPLFAGIRRLPSSIQDKVRTIRLRQRAAGLAGSLRGMGTGHQPSWWDALAQVNVPVLLITGQEDEKFTRIAREMHAALPMSRVVTVDHAGHTVHLEQPEAFRDVVQLFLAERAMGTQKGRG